MNFFEIISEKVVSHLRCPDCHADNYVVDDYYSPDPSHMDVEGVVCHQCKKVGFLPGLEEFYPGENLDEISLNVVDGKPNGFL